MLMIVNFRNLHGNVVLIIYASRGLPKTLL